MYRKPVTLEMFTDQGEFHQRTGFHPLRGGDCCANADGASCLIVASEEKAKALCTKPVWILGLGSATAPVNMLTATASGLAVAVEAGRQAYAMAGITPQHVDVAEVHDVLHHRGDDGLRELGFAKPGGGAS